MMARPFLMPFSLVLITLLFPIFFMSSPISPSSITTSQDLLVAIEEMQRATYFTYVVLINMAPPENSIQGNITFLMPRDRILANNYTQKDVADFLLRHSIPTPLLFDHLQHFPTASMLPTSKPDFMLRVGNYGRRQFFLNDVRIISPNICTAGSSIRCHGIDGVIVESKGYNTPPTACSVNSTIPPPAPALLPVVPPDNGSLNLTPAVAPATSPKKSGSSGGGLVQWVMICGLVVTMSPLYSSSY